MVRPLLALLCALVAAGCGGGPEVRGGTHLAPAPGTTIVTVDDAEIWIAGDASAFAAGAEGLTTWVERSAAEVVRFYGRFPERRLRITPRATSAGAVGFASVRTEPAMPHIRINVGARCGAPELAADWVLTHEMVHLAFPAQDRRHHWMEEGLATYIEPLCGAASGRVRREELWGVMVAKMPHGLPAAGDRGLDRTPTWGRTYWGGALFCLIADIEIRRRTGNRRGLRDAMRGLLDAGGRMSWSWPMRKALQAADAATGTTVLWEQYEAWKHTPVEVDLDALWRRLGVVPGADGRITFDDTAPLAHIRRAITRCAR